MPGSWLSANENIYASLQRDTNEIQRHKAGWLASGTHKYLDDRGLIARPRGCVRTARDAPPRSLAHACNCNGCTHPCSSDLELIHGGVTCRRTGNLTEARPRKSRRKRGDGQKRRERKRSRRRKGVKGWRRVQRRRNSYTHPVCGWRKLIQTRSFPEARFRHVTRTTLSFLRSFYARFEGPWRRETALLPTDR